MTTRRDKIMPNYWDCSINNLAEKVKPKDFRSEAVKMRDAKMEILKPVVGEVLQTIKNNAPYSELLYLKALPRNWWHPVSIELVRQLDKYIIFGLKRRFHIKDIWPSQLFEESKFNPNAAPMAGMLDTDETHLNGYGNRVLCTAIIGPILQKWLRVKSIKPQML